MPNEIPRTNGTHGIKEDDGIFLKGLIVASETVEKIWEEKSYKQLKVTITNGAKSFFYVMTDRNEEIPKVELFKRARIRVDMAQSDKGNLTVRGLFAYE